MATAPPEDQRRLLEVQALDTRLQQLVHQRRNHPALADELLQPGVEGLDLEQSALVLGGCSGHGRVLSQ